MNEIKKVFVKGRNYEDISLPIDNMNVNATKTKFEFVATFDATEGQLAEVICDRDQGDRSLEALNIILEIETAEKVVLSVPLKVYYTNSKDEISIKEFCRSVPDAWKESPHAEQDLERSVLFCSMKLVTRNEGS